MKKGCPTGRVYTLLSHRPQRTSPVSDNNLHHQLTCNKGGNTCHACDVRQRLRHRPFDMPPNTSTASGIPEAL
jgi:hypothetical protein